MFKIKKGDWIALTLLLCFLTVFGAWGVDISVAAMINHGFLTNGFWVMNSMQTYHVGLWMILTCMFASLLLNIKFVLKSWEADENVWNKYLESDSSGS